MTRGFWRRVYPERRIVSGGSKESLSIPPQVHFHRRNSSREDAKTRMFQGRTLAFFASSREALTSGISRSCFERHLLTSHFDPSLPSNHHPHSEIVKKPNFRASPATPHPNPLPAGEGDRAA